MSLAQGVVLPGCRLLHCVGHLRLSSHSYESWWSWKWNNATVCRTHHWDDESRYEPSDRCSKVVMAICFIILWKHSFICRGSRVYPMSTRCEAGIIHSSWHHQFHVNSFWEVWENQSTLKQPTETREEYNLHTQSVTWARDRPRDCNCEASELPLPPQHSPQCRAMESYNTLWYLGELE